MGVRGDRMTAGPRWRHAVGEAWRLLALAALVAVILWAVRGDRLAPIADPEIYALDLPAPLVSVHEARDLWEEGSHHFVDTRGGEPGGRPSIPGSFVVRETSFAEDLAAAMDFVYPEDHLILYGEATPLPVAAVAVRFHERGYRNVRILQGGLAAWRLAGGPLAAEVSDDD
jgi:rhodanese-related sulfurtransferase